MATSGVTFSIAGHSAWAPGIDTPQEWATWADTPYVIAGGTEPEVNQLPPMLRRRAGFLGKMAIEVAYQCLAGRTGIPAIFCSRHGDVSRAVGLLTELAQNEALSPTSFGLAVHNANAGLFSIARADRANHLALAAGPSTIEHGVIEACGLLADGAPMVLLVASDNRLPQVFATFEDCDEQPHAWAWLMVPADNDPVHLRWSAITETAAGGASTQPGSLEVWKFYMRGDRMLQRIADRRCWQWMRDA